MDRLQPGAHVLFQGDSITNAFRMPEERNDGYRMGAGYALICSAALGALRPELELRFSNRGVSGNRLEDLAARWQQDCLDLAPDLLSVLVGINDASAAAKGQAPTDAEAFAGRFRELLLRTRERLPGLRLVLLEPFRLDPPEAAPACHRALAARQQALRELAAELAADFVPLQQPLSVAADGQWQLWAYDGIHPTARGAWLIAREWLRVVAGIEIGLEAETAVT